MGLVPAAEARQAGVRAKLPGFFLGTYLVFYIQGH